MSSFFKQGSVVAILWITNLFFSSPTHAQNDLIASYPNRPIHIVVSFPPGGSPDFTARVIGQQLGKILNQSVVVENKSGAGGNVGTQFVAMSKPDGYTLLVNSSAFTVNPSLYGAKAGYDPIKDFIAVSVVSKQANVVSVNESVPVSTLAELKLLSEKDKLSFSTPGNGTTPHLTCENLFHSVWKADITHIPYKGAGPASLAVAGGETPIGCTAGFGVAQFAKQGKVKILAISSDTRSPNLPDVPTFIELGYPQINDYTLSAFFVPSKTPVAIAEKLNKAINEALANTEVREKFEKAGLVAVGGSLSFTRTSIASELKHWSQIVKSTGAKVD